MHQIGLPEHLAIIVEPLPPACGVGIVGNPEAQGDLGIGDKILSASVMYLDELRTLTGQKALNNWEQKMVPVVWREISPVVMRCWGYQDAIIKLRRIAERIIRLRLDSDITINPSNGTVDQVASADAVFLTETTTNPILILLESKRGDPNHGGGYEAQEVPDNWVSRLWRAATISRETPRQSEPVPCLKCGTTRITRCPTCQGVGRLETMGRIIVDCKSCRGKGRVICRDCFGAYAYPDPYDLDAVRVLVDDAVAKEEAQFPADSM